MHVSEFLYVRVCVPQGINLMTAMAAMSLHLAPLFPSKNFLPHGRSGLFTPPTLAKCYITVILPFFPVHNFCHYGIKTPVSLVEILNCYWSNAAETVSDEFDFYPGMNC